MSRNQKILWSAVAGVISLIAVVWIGYEIAAPNFAKGAAAPATSVGGWVQLALAIAGLCGFSGTSLTQIVLKLVESMVASRLATVQAVAAPIQSVPAGGVIGDTIQATIGQVNRLAPGFIQKIAPNVPGTVLQNGVDVAMIETLAILQDKVPAGEAHDAIVNSGRAVCDQFRDELFPPKA